MKTARIIFSAIMACLLLSSCIKDEAPNAEADITSTALEGNLLIREPVITNNEVRFYVNGWNDVTHLSPRFTLTDGATIEPESGTERDFTQPQTYTVTSQDGQWKKTYTVSFVSDDVATEYHFENIKWYEYKSSWDKDAEPKKYYHIFYDQTLDGKDMEWGSGNAGYLITASDAPADTYPTCQAEDGYRGKCAKLTTVSTGALGAFMEAPIAAGNLFTGTFEINISNMAKSTHFGLPFRKMPKELVGYYKYKAGDKFTDAKNKEVKDRKDDFALYAVLYEVTDAVPYLDGTNSLTSGNIILLAQLDERKETDEWTRFSVPFRSVEGRTVDAGKLAAGKYNLAIILSSSKDGATFSGAVGSTLWVDELQLFYE